MTLVRQTSRVGAVARRGMMRRSAAMSTHAHEFYTEEHLAVMDTITKFIDKEVNPNVDAWEKEGIFPARELFKKYGELGCLGLTKPEEYGGQGLDFSFSVAAAEALGHVGCGAIPMAIGVQTD